MRWIYAVFFISGVPALLYQIVWQRSLFAIYGINIESVTMVVSAFMLGLGLGSLLGGALSKTRLSPLRLFGIFEVAIGVFGFFSLSVFHWVEGFTAGASALETGAITFGLVLLPTILMGATLPLLVAHLVRVTGNVGRSVGALYFVNTLGSAVACFAAALVLMLWLGQSGTIRLAAVLNVTLGLAVLLLLRSRSAPAAAIVEREQTAGIAGLGLAAAIALSAASGFIALSYEILWIRAYAWASAGSALAFPLVLGTYLAGIAVGAVYSRRFCRARFGGARPLRAVAIFIVLANLIGFLVVPLAAWAARYVPYAATLPLVGVAAGALGAVFPLLCHLAVPPDARAGAGLSYLYLANIVGASLGSFLTGFVLMDHWSLGAISVFLAFGGLGIGLLLLVRAPAPGRARAVATGFTALALLFVTLGSDGLFERLYERLHWKRRYAPESEYVHVVETKSGVVAVTREGVVLGGGAYDGVFSTDPVNDRNDIFRAYALSALHPAPKQVLVIGLGSGSWAQVLAHNVHVEHLTIVEINPGYLEAARTQLAVASLFVNPKVEIVVDDGRRWLVHHPERRFDAIVMNTTFYWRSNVTNLLSREFLRLARAHLLPGGVLYYNTTWSGTVQRTGAVEFPHALRVGNFLAVSDAPIELDRARWESVLRTYLIDDKPVFQPFVSEDQAALDRLLGLVDTLRDGDPEARFAMEDRASILRRTVGEGIITDDNMGAEWSWNP